MIRYHRSHVNIIIFNLKRWRRMGYIIVVKFINVLTIGVINDIFKNLLLENIYKIILKKNQLNQIKENVIYVSNIY